MLVGCFCIFFGIVLLLLISVLYLSSFLLYFVMRCEWHFKIRLRFVGMTLSFVHFKRFSVYTMNKIYWLVLSYVFTFLWCCFSFDSFTYNKCWILLVWVRSCFIFYYFSFFCAAAAAFYLDFSALYSLVSKYFNYARNESLLCTFW